MLGAKHVPAARGLLLAIVLSVSVTGCAIQELLGLSGEEEEILQGERVPILLLESEVEADRALADLAVILPPPRLNPDWPQAGGDTSHAMHHVALGDAPVRVWDVDIGDGSGGRSRLMATPVVGDGRIYTLDADGVAMAFDAATGSEIWEVDVLPEEEDDANLAGGLAFADGRLYVTTGAAEVVAFDAATGGEIWRKRVPGPVRAAPTVYAGRVFTETVDSQLQALDARDGRELWDHAGIAELATILGYASPAAIGNTLIVAYPSGEVFAFRIDTGRTLWSETLMSIRRMDAISALPTIRGQPVVYDNQVYAISHSGRMAAIDLRTGNRVWEQNFGGIETPWIAGDFIFVMTSNAELVCLSRRNGGIRWVRPLPLYNDMEDREDPILWSGPVLASDRLIVAGNNGIIAVFSPYTGDLLSTIELDDNVSIAPIVANETVYFLTDDAELIAYR